MATYLFDSNKNLVDKNNDVDKYGFDDVKNRLLFSYQEGVYGIDEYKNMVEIEVGLPVTVPMALSDGTVLFYDRGEQYGNYRIINNEIIRVSDGIDDGSTESLNWRYLICDKSDLPNQNFQWGPEKEEGVSSTVIGAGLSNTNIMIDKYARINAVYYWKYILDKRDDTGFNWFMPSKDEISILYNNKTTVINLGVDNFYLVYWSSSEGNLYSAWFQRFSDGVQEVSNKGNNYACRLIRRV